MNIKDYALKVEYVCEGRRFTATENDDVLSFEDVGGADAVKIIARAIKPVKIELAELIYDCYFDGNEYFFANGYQSWTTSREYKRGDTQHGLKNLCKLPFVRKFAAASGDYDFAEYGKDLFHSYTYTYLRQGDKFQLFGTLNDRNGYTLFYGDVRENVFAIVKDLDGAVISGEAELFNVAKFEGACDEVFDAYFEAYPAKKTGRIERLTGYTSWYNYFQNIDERIILRDLDGISRAGEAANIFQIDDGYERAVGDWECDSSKFPDGLRPIVDKIHAQNMLAGLWLAPFAAEFSADVLKKHPDWILRDSKGRKVIGGIAWNGFYVLDHEKEEVRKYVKECFDRVFDDWGFDMVKLDFLYAACIVPRNGKTRGQLMHEAMDFLRECCRDKLILGCGVPLGPSFGIVDACRISCDVDLTFKEKFVNRITNQEVPSARMAMNNTIFRRQLDGRIFANDPDVFFLRDDGMKKVKFDWEQKLLLARINKMFGSVLFVSDDAGAYDEKKLSALLDAFEPFRGKVLSAKYKDRDNIKIIYEENGRKSALTFNAVTGENKTETL